MHIVVAIGFALALVACEGKGEPEPGPPGPVAGRASARPRLENGLRGMSPLTEQWASSGDASGLSCGDILPRDQVTALGFAEKDSVAHPGKQAWTSVFCLLSPDTSFEVLSGKQYPRALDRMRAEHRDAILEETKVPNAKRAHLAKETFPSGATLAALLVLTASERHALWVRAPLEEQTRTLAKALVAPRPPNEPGR